MAIVQSSLAEEILSRQERAVIRGIYRASQLAEAKICLEKTLATLDSCGSQQKLGSSSVHPNEAAQLNEYLSQAIRSALTNIKVPAVAQVAKKENPSKQI